jgi:hypothetical protein
MGWNDFRGPSQHVDQLVADFPYALTARLIPDSALARSCPFIAGRRVILASKARNHGSAMAGICAICSRKSGSICPRRYHETEPRYICVVPVGE